MFKRLPARILLFGFIAAFLLFSFKIAIAPAFSQMPSPFDLNTDGLLDRADFDIFLKLYGNRNQQLDFNNDNTVNVLDYNLFRTALLKPPQVCQLQCAAGYMPDTQNCRCLPSASPTPIPSGCYYKQVQCIRAPCEPILVCPSPMPSMTPRPRCCQPVCQTIGTRSEGWYDSCSNQLIRWGNCSQSEAVCRLSDTRSEGWYDNLTDQLIKWDICSSCLPPRRTSPAPTVTTRPVCGNHICELNEAVSCPAGTKCFWAGSCPSDCQPENKCVPGAYCGPGLTCNFNNSPIDSRSNTVYGICIVASTGGDKTTY